MANASSPYPPEVDAHIWRGYRHIRGQLKIGIALPRTDRAPLWAARLLNLLIAETAVKLDVVYRFTGFETPPNNSSFFKKWFTAREKDHLHQEVPIAVRPACCFVDVPYDPASGLPEESRRKIAKRNLDVLVWLGNFPLTGDASGAARLGIWSFSFGGAVRLQKSAAGLSSGTTIANYSGAGHSAALAEMPGPMLIRSFLDVLDRETPADAVDGLTGGPPIPGVTPFHWEGSWYFFLTAGDPTPETFLFYAETEDGAWRYHPANPICTDAARARNAGPLFFAGDKIIRPSRAFASSGGPDVEWNEVTWLTRNEYQEQPVPASSATG